MNILILRFFARTKFLINKYIMVFSIYCMSFTYEVSKISKDLRHIHIA
jgi:hypothetical protein